MNPTTKDEAREVAHRMAQESIGYRARRLNRFLTGVYDRAMQPHGLKISQFSLLAAIELLGPIRPGELGSKIGLEKSTVSRNVKLMAERGWIRVREADDRRSQLLEVTRKGRDRFMAAAPAWEAAEKEAKTAIGVDAAAVLDRLLARCC